MRASPETTALHDPEGTFYGVHLHATDHPAHDGAAVEFREALALGRGRWLPAWLGRLADRPGLGRHTTSRRSRVRVAFEETGNGARLWLGEEPVSPALPVPATGWAGAYGPFSVAVATSDLVTISELHAAARCGDLAAFAVDVDETAGARLLIVSRTPAVEAARVLASDLAHDRLRDAARRTGVARALRRARVAWFALEPRWRDPSRSAVDFWFNPIDGGSYRQGVYSAEDLRALAEGEGPAALTYAEMGLATPEGAHGPRRAELVEGPP